MGLFLGETAKSQNRPVSPSKGKRTPNSTGNREIGFAYLTVRGADLALLTSPPCSKVSSYRPSLTLGKRWSWGHQQLYLHGQRQACRWLEMRKDFSGISHGDVMAIIMIDTENKLVHPSPVCKAYSPHFCPLLPILIFACT